MYKLGVYQTSMCFFINILTKGGVGGVKLV